MPRTFLLAPMDRTMRLLTGLFLIMGPAFMVAGALGTRALGIPGLLVTVLMAAVYVLWRPTAFILDGGAVSLAYPVRTRRYPLANLTTAARISGDEFRARFKGAMRVGIGGAFGGFGWLWTRAGWVEMDITRVDGMVLLEWSDRSPLLLTPADPDAFVVAVTAESGLS